MRLEQALSLGITMLEMGSSHRSLSYLLHLLRPVHRQLPQVCLREQGQVISIPSQPTILGTCHRLLGKEKVLFHPRLARVRCHVLLRRPHRAHRRRLLVVPFATPSFPTRMRYPYIDFMHMDNERFLFTAPTPHLFPLEVFVLLRAKVRRVPKAKSTRHVASVGMKAT